jgi:hypothetical protein
MFPLDFVGGVVRQGGAVLDGTVSLAGARHEGEGVNEAGLAGSAVADERHVADSV